MQKAKPRVGRTWMRTLCAMAAGAALYAASSGVMETIAIARDRTTSQAPVYRSGAERSVVLLSEISATLKRMDGRLERLEKAALKPQR